MVDAVAGGVQRGDGQLARLDARAVVQSRQVGLPKDLHRQGVGQQRHPEAVGDLRELDHVVAVVVGAQDVGDGDPVALDTLEQLPGLAVAVDQHAVAARAVGDQIGVGQKLRILGALDDHGAPSEGR